MTDSLHRLYRRLRLTVVAGIAIAPLAGHADHAAAAVKTAATPARSASADDTIEKIVAVVSDVAISQGDLDNALRLAMLAGNFPDSPDTRERLTPEVLHNLIDDQIKIQEARRLKLKVDKDEIDGGLKQIADQRNATVAQLTQELAKDGVSISALERQTHAQVAWRKVIQKEIGPRIDIPAEEVDAAYTKMLSSINKPQYLLAEIFLAVDTPEKDASVKTFADQLEDQLHHGGNFSALAGQFSQAAGAAQGGDLGLVQEGELPDELDQAMRNLTPGEISEPVRTESGYHILFLRQKGNVLAGDPTEAMVHLKNIILPWPGGPLTAQPSKEEVQRLMAQAMQTRASLPNCAAMDERARHDSLTGDLGKPDQFMKVGDLSRGLATLVAPLQVNQMSQPVPTNDGVMMIMVCQRKDPPKREAPTKEQVQNQLWLERLDLQQQRYLRDLRSAAFIDVRV